MQQALEALQFYYDLHGKKPDAKVITALKQALAEPEPKPVAWICPDDPDRATAFAWRYGYCIDCGKPRIPVYTAPKGATK